MIALIISLTSVQFRAKCVYDYRRSGDEPGTAWATADGARGGDGMTLLIRFRRLIYQAKFGPWQRNQELAEGERSRGFDISSARHGKTGRRRGTSVLCYVGFFFKRTRKNQTRAATRSSVAESGLPASVPAPDSPAPWRWRPKLSGRGWDFLQGVHVGWLTGG